MADMRYALWRLSLWRWRLIAAFFGGINRRIERFHDRLHPERVIAYRCGMCEDREDGWG